MIKTEPINFLTRPDLIDKAATSLFILHAEEVITIENEEIKEDFMFIKDFFLTKYAADVSKDLLNAMQNPKIIQIQYEKIEEAFNSL